MEPHAVQAHLHGLRLRMGVGDREAPARLAPGTAVGEAADAWIAWPSGAPREAVRSSSTSKFAHTAPTASASRAPRMPPHDTKAGRRSAAERRVTSRRYEQQHRRSHGADEREHACPRGRSSRCRRKACPTHSTDIQVNASSVPIPAITPKVTTTASPTRANNLLADPAQHLVRDVERVAAGCAALPVFAAVHDARLAAIASMISKRLIWLVPS
jgi:hypothetical protein